MVRVYAQCAAMNIQDETRRIERDIRAAGFPVAELLRRAEVDVAQWQRWRNGKQDARMGTWTKIQKALGELLPDAVRMP